MPNPYSSDDTVKLTYPTIVCDNGSSTVKAGFSGDDFPRSIISTVVMTPRVKEMNLPGHQAVQTGQFIKENSDNLDITYPICHGVISDWDAMELIWDQVFYKDLLVPPEDFNVLHTESVMNTVSSREKLVEIMFELFNVPNTTLIPKSALSLYSSGRTNGVVVHSGYEDTQVVPIFEGYPLQYAVRKLPIGGNHISQHMMHLFNEQGHAFKSSNDLEIITKIKEKYCYFSIDFEKELATYSKDKEQLHTLPDGTVVKINSETFQSPEILFDPGLFNVESELGGLQDIVYDAFKACNLPEQKDMLKTILLAGGNTMLPFFSDRLKQNMVTKFTLPDNNVDVIANPERKYASWIGGSILASLSKFDTMWISRKEYEEKGPSVIQSKCGN